MLIITGQKGTEQTSLVRKRKCLRVGSPECRLTKLGRKILDVQEVTQFTSHFP